LRDKELMSIFSDVLCKLFACEDTTFTFSPCSPPLGGEMCLIARRTNTQPLEIIPKHNALIAKESNVYIVDFSKGRAL